LKTEYSQPFVQNDEVDQSKVSVSSTTTHVRTFVEKTGIFEVALGGTATSRLQSPSDFHLFGSLKDDLGVKDLEL
jgi:hypothetical protein